MALRPPAPATAWGRGLEAGFEFTLAVLGGAALGHWLDGKLQSAPLLLCVGVAFGFAVGINLLLRAVARAGRGRPGGHDG